eukprot:Opistho-2@26251
MVQSSHPSQSPTETDILRMSSSALMISTATSQARVFFGAVCGRVANRIKNGRFELDGHAVQLSVNRPPHHLHGGNSGFDRKIWKSETVESNGVRLTCTSADGEEGYPGNVSVAVTYTLTDEGALSIDYEATADKATPINLTNHSYFNLAGKGHVLDHIVGIIADSYTPVDDTIVPTGEILPVAGTPFDLNEPRLVSDGIGKVGGKGYDHNYVLLKDASVSASEPQAFAVVMDPSSGRVLRASCTQPGVQFYTGNFLDASIVMRGGVPSEAHAGLCLETQHFPDSVNNSNFPSCIVRPGETYRHTTRFEFSWQ